MQPVHKSMATGSQPSHTGGGQVQPHPYPMMQSGDGGQYMQPQVISTPSPKNPFAMSVKKCRALVGLGIVQVILGGLSIFFNGLAYYFHTSYTVIAPGIWAGITFIISGAFGIAAGLQKTNGMVVTTLVLATISAVFALIQFSIGVASLADNYDLHSLSATKWKWGSNFYEGAMAMDGLLVLFAMAVAGTTIPSSGLLCHSLCRLHMANTVPVMNQQPTAAAQCAQMPYTGAYYNPQMAYPSQLQQHPESPAPMSEDLKSRSQ